MSKIKRKKQEAFEIASKKPSANNFLFEVAWEVCNQVGGIYTVIRSKVPTAIEHWDNRYCLLGPYFEESVSAVFDETTDYSDPIGKAVLEMQSLGFDVHYGIWLITGRPKTVLINPFSIYRSLTEIKYFLWKDHDIGTPEKDDLLDQVVAFCNLATLFFRILAKPQPGNKDYVVHFHEWMTGLSIPQIRRHELPFSLIFTTHATLLGRYLAMNNNTFYENLPSFNWEKESARFGIDTQVRIERAAAHGSHVFTTVSEVTARECKYLLGREPEVIVPNGINLDRFTALHEVQNLHYQYKEKIHQFVMAHFFQNYTFDLDNTIYLFTSGRFEYQNKGFDLTLEALARLNWLMKQQDIDKTVVMFFVTKQPYHSINPGVLHSRAVLEELRQTCISIEKQMGSRLFYAAAKSTDHRLPLLNDYVEDYWKLRYRRTLQSWKTKGQPLVVTHNLKDEESDPIVGFLKKARLMNNKEDKVKVVYHPDFISSTNPLFGIEYGQFVRGCHLGVFPSYYEPWGYTPLESIARGVPAVTSDLSGFGHYVLNHLENHEEKGIYVIKRNHRSFDNAASQLASKLLSFMMRSRRERIEQRNRADNTAVDFDWQTLYQYYSKAYKLAIERR
jgi:glycogen(starch) synthase